MENKNTSKKLWFKAKRYGWGWYPVTWQGWVVVLIYSLLIGYIALRAVTITENTTNTATAFIWNYFPPLVFVTLILIWICYKTGEKPRWRWGN